MLHAHRVQSRLASTDTRRTMLLFDTSELLAPKLSWTFTLCSCGPAAGSTPLGSCTPLVTCCANAWKTAVLDWSTPHAAGWGFAS